MLHKRHIALYLFPLVAIVTVFLMIPLVFTFIVSFKEWNGLSPMKHVGWANYERLMSDPVFIISIKNTLLWIGAAVLVHIPLGLLLALVLSKKPSGWRFFRTVFFLPNVISSTAIAMLWYFTFHNKIGMINGFFWSVGLDDWARPWLNDPNLAVFVTMVPFILYVGVTMVIFLMQITSIPQEIYEAAEIDGARGWQKDWRITIPLLRGAIAINVIFNVATCLKMFEYPWIMTSGGPARSSMNVSLYIYQEMMTANRYGVSMAAGLLTIIFGVLVMASSLYAVRWAERRGG